jgi:hypothetical protein
MSALHIAWRYLSQSISQLDPGTSPEPEGPAPPVWDTKDTDLLEMATNQAAGHHERARVLIDKYVECDGDLLPGIRLLRARQLAYEGCTRDAQKLYKTIIQNGHRGCEHALEEFPS